MMPSLYYFDRSPYCIALLRALNAAGVEPTLVSVSSVDRSAVIKLTAGAYYMVPVIHDDGAVIYESCAESQDVAEYIDNKYVSGRLFPTELQGLQTILLRYLENDVESITFKIGDALFIPTITDLVERTMIIRHKERKFGVGCVDCWRHELDALVGTARTLLAPFEAMLATKHHSFLLGAAPVYSDFLLYGLMANYTYRDLMPFPPGLPGSWEWNERMRTYHFAPSPREETASAARGIKR